MKILCGLLIAFFILHLHCEGSCLSESLNATTQPPCHKHAGSSSDKPHGDVCTQGPVVESKLTFQPVAVLPEISISLLQPSLTITSLLIEDGPAVIVPSPIPISVLRI
jgi:hypothetical protein